METGERLGPIGEDTVARLLSRRSRTEDSGCELTPLVALVIQGIADREQIATVDAHLTTCAECRESVLLLHGAPNRVHDARERPEAPRAGARKRHLMPIAAAVLAAMSAVTYFALRDMSPRPTGPVAGDGLTVKGASDTLFVVVARGTERFRAEPLDPLREGDEITFFYTAPRSGYLAVLNRDEAGRVTPLVPASRTESIPVTPGDRVPLSDGAVVRSGRGCEWVVGVFSDAPLVIDEVVRAMERGRPQDASEACRYRVSVPGARYVDVLPIRR